MHTGPYSFTCTNCNQPSTEDLTEEDLEDGVKDGTLTCRDCLERIMTNDAIVATATEAPPAEDLLAANAQFYYRTHKEALN